MRNYAAEITVVLIFMLGGVAFLAGCCKPCPPPPDGVARWLKDPPPATPKEARIEEGRARRGDYYARRLGFFLDDNPQRTPGGIVFLGDSITEGFPVEAALADRNAINRGISGDTIEGLRERLDVCVVALKPRRVYVKIGINNILGGRLGSIAMLADSYDRLAADLRAAAPEAEVICLSVLPVGGDRLPYNTDVNWLNTRIRRITEKYNFSYLDLHPFMADATGALHPDFHTDGLHLNLDGYLALLEGILEPEDFVKAAAKLSDRWTSMASRRYMINKTDPRLEGAYPGNRGPDEMVIYTPASGRPTTKTNEWGIEAIVENNRVTKINQGNSPIPPNGFVVSGHGRADNWIQLHLQPGTVVTLEKNNTILRIVRRSEETAAAAPPDAREQLLLLRVRAIAVLCEAIRTQATAENYAEAQAVTKAVVGLRRATTTPPQMELDALSTRLGVLENTFGITDPPGL